jgi:hypothetical protein
VLFALAGEAIGIGGAQALVGLGMGTGVGLLQGRAVRTFLGRALPWTLASAVGLALPFLVVDVATRGTRNPQYSVMLCVALGGLIVGGCQALLLRPRVIGAAWWFAGSAAGWGLAAAMTGLTDTLGKANSLRGVLGAAVYLGTVAAAGVVLGVTTGSVLHRMQPRSKSSPM